MLLGQQTPKLIPKTAYALSKNDKTSSVLGDKLGQRQPHNRPRSKATLQSPQVKGNLTNVPGQRQPYNRPRSKATLQSPQVKGHLTIAPGQRQPYNRPRSKATLQSPQVKATLQSPQSGCPIKPQVKTKIVQVELIGQKVRHSGATSWTTPAAPVIPETENKSQSRNPTATFTSSRPQW